jgi:hypothetical protein
LLSEVTIASPLCAHRGVLGVKSHHHIASCPLIETVSDTVAAHQGPCLSYFFLTFRRKIEGAAQ